ncbi:MAG TPA: glucose 1-dehydrogenase [Stellaceae bacterium]|nr:glucose 1-dehydrogenase [Stellaceae bacterium]
MTEPTPVAVITGASRGIGAATAEALAARGLAVFLAAEGTAAELATGIAACRSKGAPDAASGIFDLGRAGEPEAMIAAALERFGRIDLLVNNAGIRCRKPFGEFTRADFDSLVSVNLAAAFFASQAVLPAMRAQGGGRIIHVASQFGTVSAPEHALYGLTKAALIHLARSMAIELGPKNILVNTVSPGPIATQFNMDRWEVDPAFRESLVKEVPAGRPGTPAEIAEAIAFLATTHGRFIQGHDLVVDGGFSIH